LDITGANWKVDKRKKDYKILKEIFPDCDYIFNLRKAESLYNDRDEYKSVLQFISKGINEPLGTFIYEEPLDDEAYELVYKLTGGEWGIEFTAYKTYDSYGYTIYGVGEIKCKKKGKKTVYYIDWKLEPDAYTDEELEEDYNDDE